MHDWDWSFHMGWMMIWWVLGGIAFVSFLVWLTRSAGGEARTPEQTLKERYARGEIEREEYEQKLADLRR